MVSRRLPARFAVVAGIAIPTDDDLTLTWARTGSPASWHVHRPLEPYADRPPAMLVPLTPAPWSYALGCVQYEHPLVRPLILFKNAVPMFELTSVMSLGLVDQATWGVLAAAALSRNPGLHGLLSALGERGPWSVRHEPTT